MARSKYSETSRTGRTNLLITTRRARLPCSVNVALQACVREMRPRQIRLRWRFGATTGVAFHCLRIMAAQKTGTKEVSDGAGGSDGSGREFQK